MFEIAQEEFAAGDKGKMARPKREAAENTAAASIVDRAAALRLSAALAGDNRLGFAQAFCAAIVDGLRDSGALDPSLPAAPGNVRSRLSRKAEFAAQRIAEGLRSVRAAETAHVIGTLYTTLLPEAFRGRHGIFYTPPLLVEALLTLAEEAGTDWSAAHVLDPACGGGAFLVGIAGRMLKALEGVEPAIAMQNIAARLRGFDLDPFGAWLAQAMLSIALRPVARAAGRQVLGMVETRDSLELRPEEAESRDLVIGNPPYGRVTLSQERRRLYSRSVYGHANLYGVFTEAALHWAKPGAIIGFVTPTSMLSGLYYKALRSLLAAEAPPLAIHFVSERDGVFADVLQETMLATYRKGGMPVAGKVGFIDAARNREILRRRTGRFTLPATPASPWLLPRAPEQAGFTRRLRSMPHRLADYGYGVSTGPLVWNRFKEQFRIHAGAGNFPVIWAESVTSDGRFAWRSEKRNHAPWFAPRRPKDDWLIVTRTCVLLQRTTAKEQPRRLIAAELPASFIRRHGGVTVENHLNMVRPIVAEPLVSPAVIAALLNSAALDAAFRCLNGSVAVSAFELEELPLPNPAFVTRVARLVAGGAPADRIECVIDAAYGGKYAAAAA